MLLGLGGGGRSGTGGISLASDSGLELDEELELGSEIGSGSGGSGSGSWGPATSSPRICSNSSTSSDAISLLCFGAADEAFGLDLFFGAAGLRIAK